MIVTQPDKPKGRGRETEPSVIAKMAKAAGVRCLQPANAADSSFLEEMKKLQPDLAAVVSYGQILKDEFLAIPRLGCFNLHASLLPRHRGASPIAAAILAGDKETGVSVQRIVRKLDAGDIVSQKMIPIQDRDTTGDLLDALSRHGAELLVETLALLESGKASFTPQEELKVTYAPKLKKEFGIIDWTKTAEEVDRHVRAMLPWPGAYANIPTTKGPVRVLVLAGIPVEKPVPLATRSILEVSKDGIDISCGTGVFRIKALQPEGKKPMPISAFIAGHQIKPGTALP